MRYFKHLWRILAVSGAFALAGSLAAQAFAAASPWAKTEHGAVRLIAVSNAAGDREIHRFGLHFRMEPGWKIYWRSPGDAGFPPQPDWAGSENLLEARLVWPAPERFSVLGLETLGYKKEVVLPVDVQPLEAGKGLRLRARVRYLTCSDICVPYDARLALDLPAGPETSSREAALIERYLARVPARDDSAGLHIIQAAVAGRGASQALEISVSSDTVFSAPDLYVEGPGTHGFAAPDVRIAADRRSALMRVAVAVPKGEDTDLVGNEVTLTLIDGHRAIERAVTLAAPLSANNGAPRETADGSRTLIAILGLALLGGLILNLMPCVLPVLSIKLLSVVGHAGGPAREVRHGFLASAAGILFSFLLLASGAVGLTLAGGAAGWGIQFQQPMFLAVMVLILVLFACNLWGLFEIRLPGAVADAAVEGGTAPGLAGHFLTGAFATLLATPCSAPFLGSAVGFALSRGPLEIYAVFAVLGVGLALPYLAIAAFPTLAMRLPRPGPWMIMLRRVLAFALLATALWLLSVLTIQQGYATAGAIALMMVAIIVALWQARYLTGLARRASWGVVGALGLLTLGTAAAVGGGSGLSTSGSVDGVWQAFDRPAIHREVDRGRIVFVDVTADWCLTCQVNKALVLNRGDILVQLRGDGVTAMRADWTKPSRDISDYLASFGRYGIPFNAVYGPGAPNGLPLPEILTEANVLAALERAAGGTRLSGQ